MAIDKIYFYGQKIVNGGEIKVYNGEFEKKDTYTVEQTLVISKFQEQRSNLLVIRVQCYFVNGSQFAYVELESSFVVFLNNAEYNTIDDKIKFAEALYIAYSNALQQLTYFSKMKEFGNYGLISVYSFKLLLDDIKSGLIPMPIFV